MINAIGEYLAVLPVKVDEKTAGGVLLPDEHRDRQQYKASRGEVISIGQWAFHLGGVELPDAPKVGDLVIYPTYEGVVEKGANGEDIRILKDSDIVGVIRDE